MGALTRLIRPKFTINFCQVNFRDTWTKELWLSNSLDLNPMDFSVWSILESKACTKENRLIEVLKRSLEKVWAEILVETLAKIVGNFGKRLKFCVAAGEIFGLKTYVRTCVTLYIYTRCSFYFLRLFFCITFDWYIIFLKFVFFYLKDYIKLI